MNGLRASPRAFRPLFRDAAHLQQKHLTCQRRAITNHGTSSYRHEFKQRRLLLTGLIALGTVGAVAITSRPTLYADTPAASPAEIEIEKTVNTKGLSKEETRSAISSQHHQVQVSWENPGVYAWGSNSGRVAAPESDEAFIKTPRRIPFFNDMLLRDVKLDRRFGAAITEKGDLLQWGVDYAADCRQPTPTLVGKNLISIEITKNLIIGLSSSGTVYSIPVSAEDQVVGPKPSESTWIPFWTSRSAVSYRTINIRNLAWGEKVSNIKSGVEHLLLLTSNGRLFSAVPSSEDFPSRGELGVPGLTLATRPHGPFDQPHEITTLRGFEIVGIAAGDHHSMVVDKDGRAFSFGDNSSGQLGFDPSSESPFVDAPSLLPITRLYSGTNMSPAVTSVSAGGANSFITIDATRVAGAREESPSRAALGRITADTWSCGQGIVGTLGNGRWSHLQGTPIKIKSLSGLFEYDETNNSVIPIRLRRLSVGATHASATMDNVTHVAAGLSKATDSRNDTNWGADVVWWGGNEHFQLGTGKRNNLSVPGYIQPLDTVAERERAKRKEEHRFQITPRHRVSIKGRKVSMEQRVECGRMVSAVYSGT